MAAGDRLEVEHRVPGTRLAYLHHGVDVGDGTVVHARPDDFRRPFAGGRVVRTGLAEFAAGEAVRVSREPPARYPAADIVARALGQVGRPGYCPVVDNCEHFATWCATGEPASRQADILVSRLRSAAGRIALAASARRVLGVAAGSAARVSLRGVVPATLVAEGIALGVEWRAHRAGRPAAVSRRAGELAGLVTAAATCGLAGASGGPAGAVLGAWAGAAAWVAGSLAGGPRGRTAGQEP